MKRMYDVNESAKPKCFRCNKTAIYEDRVYHDSDENPLIYFLCKKHYLIAMDIVLPSDMYHEIHKIGLLDHVDIATTKRMAHYHKMIMKRLSDEEKADLFAFVARGEF